MTLPATLHVTGACHCGAVRFECELDTSQPTSRCNCSACAKSRYWKAFVGADAFRLLQGEHELAEYRFGSRRIAHRFCRRCGVKLFGHGAQGDFPAAFYAINVAALEGLDDETLAALPLVFQDGRHDAWERPPATTAHL
jgi:hypothetical protein